MYIDGLIAGQLPLPGTTNATDGGQPIQLDTADIFLCSRSDADPERHFSGSITHLGLWSEALTPDQAWLNLAVGSLQHGCLVIYCCSCAARL